MLQGRKILLAITGSIAAYKAAFLCRLLVKNGCEVKVVMTPTSKDFITPLTLTTLSGHAVHYEITDGHSWNNHVELGLWADIMIVAPCTATTLGKMANGIADNMVLACYLSAKCQVWIAPAMDLDMWQHPSVLDNISKLTSYGNHIIPVGNGYLASGLYGEGRMAEPEEIIESLEFFITKHQDLKGKKVLITAGPTFEAIDPVRFIGNRSSGKMGYAIADECRRRGANVTLISGPVHIQTKYTDICIEKVESALEMFKATENHFEKADIIIFAAAVADYRPVEIAHNKIKKTGETLGLTLTKTTDIAGTLAKRKSKNQIMVGFALETNNEFENASKKLHTKSFDFIVLNTLNDAGAGFQHDTNKVTIIDNKGNKKELPLKSKSDVAKDIIDYYLYLQS